MLPALANTFPFFALAAAAAAQLLPGSIAADNVQFGYQAFPSSPCAAGGSADLRTAGRAAARYDRAPP